MAGSGLFSNKAGVLAHLLVSHGTLREVNDVRQDLGSTFGPVAAITVEEFTNPATGATTDLLAATASTVAVQTYTAGTLLAPGIASLAALPRNITFTTAGSTATDAPATVVVTGTYRGKVQTETVTVSQTAATATGLKPFSTITSIVYAAGDGTGATVAIGIGGGIGVTMVPKSRAGGVTLISENVDGAKVTSGALTAAGLYTPATAPNGVHDYCAYYEYNPLV